VKGEELRNSADYKYPLDDVYSKLPPNVMNRKLEHLPDDVHDKTKRRALLVGITYSSPSNTWSQLDGPHGDVDQYQDLLISA
jgi:hypothetical protein